MQVFNRVLKERTLELISLAQPSSPAERLHFLDFADGVLCPAASAPSPLVSKASGDNTLIESAAVVAPSKAKKARNKKKRKQQAILQQLSQPFSVPDTAVKPQFMLDGTHLNPDYVDQLLQPALEASLALRLPRPQIPEQDIQSTQAFPTLQASQTIPLQTTPAPQSPPSPAPQYTPSTNPNSVEQI